jgi:sortase A
MTDTELTQPRRDTERANTAATDAVVAETPLLPPANREPAGPPAGASPQRPTPPRSLLRWSGMVITTFGVLIAVFATYVFVFTALQGDRSQRRLLTHFKPGAPALRGQLPPQGAPVALLKISALHLDEAVVEGTSARDLESGPGLMPGSVLPGMTGNAVIAGRRVAFGHPFADLGRLRAGDTIEMTDALGTFVYVVSHGGKVTSGQTDPISPATRPVLTLITSNPPVLATGRLVVVASLKGKPVDDAALLPAALPSPTQRRLGGDPAAIAPAIVWTELLLLVVAATAFTYRRWRQPAAVYLLSTPILLALMLLSFENLIRLFPGTL